MVFLVYFSIFLFGLAVGSFLNSIVDRMEKGESAFKGRSYCPQCHHQLSWQDLIPLLSFLTLKGRCRYCRGKISLQYPLVELATGFLFVFVFQLIISSQQLAIGNFPIFLYLLLTACLLLIIFIYDLKHYIIPDKVIYSAIAITFLYRLFENWKLGIGDLGPLRAVFLSAILASAFFLAIFLLSKGRWLGFGDVKLAFFMGLFLSFPNILVALFLAFLIGAIIGIGLIVFRKKQMRSEVPFGPFLVVGTFLALFWGSQIVNWYFNLFL